MARREDRHQMRTGAGSLRPFTPRSLPPADAVVVGPPSSGTRLVTRLLRSSGRTVRHDMTHGRTPVNARAVVTTSRGRKAHAASLVARGFPRSETTEGALALIDETTERITTAYPDAPCVSYEALIEDRDAELGRIAKALGWAPWTAAEVVTDENEKHR